MKISLIQFIIKIKNFLQFFENFLKKKDSVKSYQLKRNLNFKHKHDWIISNSMVKENLKKIEKSFEIRKFFWASFFFWSWIEFSYIYIIFSLESWYIRRRKKPLSKGLSVLPRVIFNFEAHYIRRTDEATLPEVAVRAANSEKRFDHDLSCCASGIVPPTLNLEHCRSRSYNTHDGRSLE